MRFIETDADEVFPVEAGRQLAQTTEELRSAEVMTVFSVPHHTSFYCHVLVFNGQGG